MRSSLQAITLRGFRTVKQWDNFTLGPLTVLIGPNGAGKSNVFSFLRMLGWAMEDPKNLAHYVGQQGGASKILHGCSNSTREISAEITIGTDGGEIKYEFRLTRTPGDALMFANERCLFPGRNHTSNPSRLEMGAGHFAPNLIGEATRNQRAKAVLSLLRGIARYQFHNTSFTSRIRNKWSVGHNRCLKEDGANIAPVLLRLNEQEVEYYQRIVDTIRLILPLFSDFEFEPESGHLVLAWRERLSDQLFTVSQASDVMLRVMALVTILLQPGKDLPDVLILDEPELGLHPYAITAIGGLIRAAARRVQVVVATQSTTLVDCFEPEDIVVVNRKSRGSEFRRLCAENLSEWLTKYSLSELWEKNVIGGRPLSSA